jgi:hypothetical protein
LCAVSLLRSSSMRQGPHPRESGLRSGSSDRRVFMKMMRDIYGHSGPIVEAPPRTIHSKADSLSSFESVRLRLGTGLIDPP